VVNQPFFLILGAVFGRFLHIAEQVAVYTFIYTPPPKPFKFYPDSPFNLGAFQLIFLMSLNMDCIKLENDFQTYISIQISPTVIQLN